MRRALSWITAALICSGCVGTIDAVSVVRGHLVRSDGSDLTGCVASLYRSNTRERLTKYDRPVDARFFVSIVNAPSSGNAFIEFTCPGLAGVIRSVDFSLSAAGESNGIDIGRVTAAR
jgi:hypothetical protein